MSNPIALSFSRISDYEQCPKKFESKYITKTYPDDSNNIAFAKGNEIHSQLEKYIIFLKNNEQEPSLNTICKNVKPLLDNLYKACNGNIYPEKQIALDMNWEKCDWFDKPHIVKFRAIVDCLAFVNDETLMIIDFKSGKVRPYEEGETTQLKLTAAMLFSLYPNINNISSSYLFVEHKKTIKKDFSRDQYESLRKPFDDIYDIINQDGEFNYKKNKYCNWCLLTNEHCPIKK